MAKAEKAVPVTQEEPRDDANPNDGRVTMKHPKMNGEAHVLTGDVATWEARGWAKVAL